ncbi:MAG: sulfatase-like hydrolase/transferase, partial [Verrucomicrobiota bacterium]
KVPTFDPMRRPKGNSSRTWWAFLGQEAEAQPYGTHYWNEKGERVVENLRGSNSRVIMDRAIPFIRSSVEADRAFFTVIWFHAPHLPVVAGPEHLKGYEQFSEYEKNYYGCITALDEQVGRLRKVLRELGVEKDTVVTFCSDNGPEGKYGAAPGSAGPFRGRKRSLYEGGVRIPGLIEWPGTVRPSETGMAAVTSDYLPTILDIVGLERPDSRPLDGESLLPVLKGERKKRMTSIAFRSKKQRAFHSGSMKIISADDGTSWELYDLDVDPFEKKNLATQRPDQLAEMIKQSEAWVRSCQRSDEGDDYDRE